MFLLFLWTILSLTQKTDRKIRQEIMDTDNYSLKIRYTSKFESKHSILIELPFHTRPHLYSISSKIKYEYDETENKIFVKTLGPVEFDLQIIKHLQPVFVLTANIDNGLYFGPPLLIAGEYFETGNPLIDHYILPDVSFPFLAFSIITITTFFVFQFHITRLFVTKKEEK